MTSNTLPTHQEACQFDNCLAPATVATFVRFNNPLGEPPAAEPPQRLVLFTGSIHSCWVHSLEIRTEPYITVLAREFLQPTTA